MAQQLTLPGVRMRPTKADLMRHIRERLEVARTRRLLRAEAKRKKKAHRRDAKGAEGAQREHA